VSGGPISNRPHCSALAPLATDGSTPLARSLTCAPGAAAASAAETGDDEEDDTAALAASRLQDPPVQLPADVSPSSFCWALTRLGRARCNAQPLCAACSAIGSPAPPMCLDRAQAAAVGAADHIMCD